MNRVILIVLDSAGIGAMPDAASFGDAGADTVGHIIEKRGLNTPNMDRLGLRSIGGTSFHTSIAGVFGCFGKASEQAQAKDTISGHWEIAGYLIAAPFRTYPDGFPADLISEYEEKIERKTLGNCVASGTEIIQRLGEEHMKTGFPIVYTSADSVFQIAAHEEILPINELYRICEVAREMLVGDRTVGRVIARPFTGNPGGFNRTERRRDYALAPERDTILDAIVKAGMDVAAVGKIEDIFCRRGITKIAHTATNAAGIEATVKFMQSDMNGLIFTNLVDFDMLYGHRNDIAGYGAALEYFDAKLPEILAAMRPDDLLIITADHGCDPSFPGTDHTREYVPILCAGRRLRQNIDLGVRDTFADIGATIVDWLGLGGWNCGKSFLPEIVDNQSV